MSDADWRILFVGGHSGAGKTTLAQQLARHFGVSMLQVDDVRLAAQQLTTPAQQPALHFFLDDAVWQRSPAALCAGLVAVAHTLAPALATIAAHHLAVADAGPLIIEGDGIAPALAADPARFAQPFPAFRAGIDVHAVFVVEPDLETIWQTMHRRGRGFDATPSEWQRRISAMSWQYGQWLQAEAARHQQPVIAAQPWPTLLDRARAALKG